MAYFIHVDATNEAVYELVVEPVQELQVGEHQEDAVEHAPEEIANPADLQGMPRSITLILSIQYLFKYFVRLRSGVVWNSSMHVLPRYLRVNTSMQMSLEMLC